MVEVPRIDRVRVVEDKVDVGSVISSDVVATDRDTLFPLQAALGYDIAQSLFIGPANLVVEGPSDVVYLTALSALAVAAGREALDSRWTLTPVGGADKIPTFIALLGVHLPVTVLADTPAANSPKLKQLMNQRMLEAKRLFSPTRYCAIGDADIEDLFEPGDYLALYNGAFNETVDEAQLIGQDSIVRRIARLRGGDFDHLRPALFLVSHEGQRAAAGFSTVTLDRFIALFHDLNIALPTPA